MRHYVFLPAFGILLFVNGLAAQLTITTTSLPNATALTPYSQTLTASGADGVPSWSLTGGLLPAGLNLSANGEISGIPLLPGNSNFMVTVGDNSKKTVSKGLSIRVVAAAPLTVTTASLPSGTIGTPYSQTLTATGGSGGYSWSITGGALPAGLNLSTSGAISGTPTASTTSNFTVTVTDSGSQTATKALSIVVTFPPLSITTASLPSGTPGTAYSQTLTAAGGSGGYSWSITAGALPAGLTLDASSGTISGTPTAAGTANFTVTVTDSGNRTATKALSIVIAPAPLTITTSTLPNATAGTPYSQTLAATGSTGSYTWSVTAGALPGGLTLSASGTISGTPGTAGTSNFTVQAKDASGTATKALTLVVAAAPLLITTDSLPPAEQGVAYSFSLVPSGGSGGYSWSITGGALPAGLALDASGRITGTPSGLTSTFTVQLADSAGKLATKSFNLQVVPAPTFSTQTTLAAGVTGTAYDAVVQITGGQPPYTLSLTSGQLPPGLALNATNAHISGMPSQVGNFSFGLQARDSAGGQAQATFSIAIANTLTITSPPVLPGASLAIAYQMTLVAAGGAAPYTWSATAGSLPAGLTFHPEGRIDGTPTAAGSFSFTAAVSDANGSRASKDFTLAVAGALTITTAPQLDPAVLGASYTATFVANGGSPPYTWSITSGAPPVGLTFAAGTLSGTPTTPGTSTFTATVTDTASVSAAKSFTLTVAAGVTFATPATLPDAVAGTPYSFTLAAAGGRAPYSFRMSGGALPDGLSLNGASGIISGTPSAAGTFNFTLEAADSAGLKASRVHTIVTDLPTVPTLSMAGVPAALNALQQPAIDLVLGAPFPVAITGRLNLVFVPASGLPDDPAVQFSTGGRSVAFNIPANATHATFAAPLAMQSGSVAGTIQFMVESLTAGTVALPAPGDPVLTSQVTNGVPSIRSMTVTRGANGFSLQIVGLSTTRDLASATVRFVPGAGSAVQTAQVTIPLNDSAGTWFKSSTSLSFGGQFTLTLPFSVSGGTAALDSVAVVLTNSVGASQELSAPY